MDLQEAMQLETQTLKMDRPGALAEVVGAHRIRTVVVDRMVLQVVVHTLHMDCWAVEKVLKHIDPPLIPPVVGRQRKDLMDR